MVKALEQEHESYKSKLFHFKGMFENTGRHTKSLSIESASKLDVTEEDIVSSKSQGSKLNELDKNKNNNNNNKSPAATPAKPRVMSKEEIELKEQKDKLLQEMEQMKERFAKLLLGEDMSGGGKGVSSALALSNAFTNLAASIFGEQRRLEPMPPERKAKWKKEIDWLLSVTEYIVEMVPQQQKNKDGTTMEIMTTRQRTDLHMNIPALKKLDTMLLECLDGFQEKQEFYYVKKDASDDSEKDGGKNDDKWWLPTPKVPVDGLSEASRRFRSITVEFFDPDQFLSTVDLSSEHKILDLKNRIEASMVIWRRKMNQKDSKSSWSSAVSLEKREQFEDRAETILLLIKHRFPGAPQSALDISKIQFNRDVGQACLESYSRILESLAYTVLSRIEDVQYADQQTQNPRKSNAAKSSIPRAPTTPKDDADSGSMTLSDFMGWNGGDHSNKDPFAATDDFYKDIDNGKGQKLPNVTTDKKVSYLDSLGGMRSPTSRH